MTTEFEDLISCVDANETADCHHKIIRHQAEVSFKDHVIKEEQPGVFRCGKPESGIYAFRVAFLPAGLIVCYGDIGDLMLQRGGEAWLRGAIRHDYVSEYIFEKVLPSRSRHRVGRFMPGDALEALREIHDGVPYVDSKGINFVEQARSDGDEPGEGDWDQPPNPDLAIRIAEDWLHYDSSGADGDAWSRAYYGHTDDLEYPNCYDYESNDLWCYFGLSWFVRQRKEEQGHVAQSVVS